MKDIFPVTEKCSKTDILFDRHDRVGKAQINEAIDLEKYRTKKKAPIIYRCEQHIRKDALRFPLTTLPVNYNLGVAYSTF